MKTPIVAGAAVLGAVCLGGPTVSAKPMDSISTTTTYHRATVDGVSIFYREAGDPTAPTILLLHGLRRVCVLHRGAGLLHEGRFRTVARELEREVGFNGGVDLALTTVINIPTAIEELAFQDMLDATALERLVHLSDPMHEEHVIGAKRAIDHQLADPMAIGLLLPEQVALRARDRLRQLLVGRQARLVGLRYPRQRNDVG